MLDRLTGLQVFAKVAALGSLSGAARSLGMSQTMATKHMAALEDRLGLKLLHRTTRKVTLTEPGRHYLDSVERLLSDLGEAEASLIAERLEVTGTLRLNAPVSFGVREIAPILSDFSRLHPGLTVDLGLNDRVVDLVEEGWDAAIRIGRLQAPTLIARRLAPCRLMVAAAPAYLAARGTPRLVADLTDHDCLGYTLSPALGAHRWQFGRDGSVEVAVSGSLRANNGDALVAAALAGQGIVYEPSFLLGDAIRAGRLVPLSLDHPSLDMPGVHAVHALDRRPPAKVRALIDFLAARFGPNPPWDRDLPEG